jgi:hypothetical protein
MDPLHSVTQFLPELGKIEAAEVSELDSLELGPETLPRIQLRGIGREALQVDKDVASSSCLVTRMGARDEILAGRGPVPSH